MGKGGWFKDAKELFSKGTPAGSNHDLSNEQNRANWNGKYVWVSHKKRIPKPTFNNEMYREINHKQRLVAGGNSGRVGHKKQGRVKAGLQAPSAPSSQALAHIAAALPSPGAAIQGRPPADWQIAGETETVMGSLALPLLVA